MAADRLAPLRWLALCSPVLLAACASSIDRAPASANRAWQPPAAPAQWRALATESPALPVRPAADRDYDLPALIDMAQRNNPATRLAWSQARQAASAVGLAESTYLPRLSATVITGRLETDRRLPEILGQRPTIDSSLRGTVPALTLEWLLFDFGMRASANEAARNLSLGANFLFNLVHQKLVYDVSRNYYEYGAARQRTRISAETLQNSESVLAAVMAKRKSGLATSIEEAQARQLVAQARLQQVRSAGLERNAYQALLDHLGLPPGTPVRVADSAAAPLPSAQELPQGAILQRALAERPDIMASIASLKAAENGVDVAQADFLPKVFLAGFYMGGHNKLSIGPVSGLSNGSVTRGVLLGLTMPLYDGGMRSSRLHDARERVQAAQAALEKLRNTAMSEIVIASNLLETALQSYEAASTLVDTTALTYDAALDAYKQGLGTITAATEAANGLLSARIARADAHAAAQVAAVSLAFALGKLNDSLVPPSGGESR
ncbi:TolC family protein [Bordetella avium]|uniref:TolC family protein n=1 Tax=Bordetella avium TaxID=521 RepID=UPI000E67AFE8|nr:TolC family protein [Bordetella avium]AZY51891.1 TolC family protein [Bordetella avium]RIQ73276.1 TolC family protein [Bordetella avium]